MESTGDCGCGEARGGQLRPELGFPEIETKAEVLARGEVFHVVKEILGFVLFMHNQIPVVLKDLEDGFNSLKVELKTLMGPDSAPSGPKPKPADIRKHNMRKKEIKQGIKRHEKLMKGIYTLLSSFQDALDSLSRIEGVVLVIGGSIARPLYVYDMSFSLPKFGSSTAREGVDSKLAQTIAKKSIRSLISNDGGSSSDTGPSKLFLLIKGPCNFNMPLHFLPKRDFRYRKQVVPSGLLIKCRSMDSQKDDKNNGQQNLDSNDFIWFQCRHAVKGLACKTSEQC
ncbi:hypothetical protein LUZ60_011606 [Juncus effusus]|nr:hypothetical protein LUZ60_011606 [Juncus effusus]